jgi:hypothetical protein
MVVVFLVMKVMNLNLWVVDEVEEEDEYVLNCSAKKKISCRIYVEGQKRNQPLVERDEKKWWW